MTFFYYQWVDGLKGTGQFHIKSIGSPSKRRPHSRRTPTPMSVSFTWSDSWDRRICGVLGLWKDVSSAPVEEPADVGQSRSPGGRTSRQVMHMDKSCPHLTDDKKTSEIYIFKTCWPFLVSEIIILWEEMSQLANVHYQVVPMRTADALPPEQCDSLLPKLPVQQTFQYLHVRSSMQQSHPHHSQSRGKTQRSGMKLDWSNL